MNKILYYIISILILISCKSEINNIESEEWNRANKSLLLEDYISFAFEFPKSQHIDSCINKIDSIVRDNSGISISCWHGVDSIRNKFVAFFSDINNYDYDIGKRNALIITVTDSTANYNSKHISKENLYEMLKGYHTNHRYEEDYPQSRDFTSKLFGTIIVSKICVVIDTDKKNLTDQDTINWQLYLSTLQDVKMCYMDLWNYKSNLIWQTDFKNLEYKKKIAIVETTGFGIELNFITRKFIR
ncbi:MAG: hypothetical protein N4A72_17125 [Bacteroidales bacterium]|jgi:hypothetical protein|nr:hypothetical protein [Bacteroidales bacterium]